VKSTLSPLFLLFIVFICSCSKKPDNAIVPQLGTIAISGIHQADTLKGTITAQVNLTGSVQPSKLEIYANDSLIVTSTKAPYNLQWNTLGVKDGNYKLKAIAYDNSGKQTQVALDVVINNVLVTLIIDPHINSIYTNIIYIVTDSAGNLLNSVKYNGTDKVIKIGSTKPNLNTRCSVFEVKTDPSPQTYVTGYMTIPKGSAWDLTGITEVQPDKYYNSSLTFTNLPSFTRMTISTDEGGFTFNTPEAVGNITNYGFSSTTKEFVQYVDANNNGHYGFFPLDIMQSNIAMNLADSTFNNSVKKTISIPGATSINVSLYGRWNKSFYSYYVLDNTFYQNANATYFYPDGNYLTDYISSVYYVQNGWTYWNDYSSLPPDAVAPFGTTVTINNNTLGSFDFTAQGAFDYYNAVFSDAANRIYVSINSPAAYTSFRFPNILGLTNIANEPLNNLKPYTFTLFKVPGFNERKLIYYNTNEYPAYTLPSQSATKYF